MKKNLPPGALAQLSNETGGAGNEIAYAVIPLIQGLQEPLRTQTRMAFAASLRLIWHMLLGVCGLGLLSVLLMREIPMQQVTADEYGMRDKKMKLKGEKSEDLDEKATDA